MKTTITISFVLLLLLIFSCNQGVQLKPKTHEYFVLEQLQNAVISEFYRGREKFDALRETANDRSEAERSIRATELFNSVLCIDSTVSDFLKVIRMVKKEMITDKSELKRMFTEVRNQPALPFTFQLEKVRIIPVKQANQKIEKIQKAFVEVRKCIVEEIASYESGDSIIGDYFFKDPDLQEFASNKKAYKQIESAISNSNVAQDDKEAIKKIYVSMTKFIFEMPETVSNSVDFFTLLTAVELSAISSRSDALSLLKARAGCCGCYSFDRILPFVDCPTVSQVGDTITVSGMMAAYDSDKPPLIIANDQKFMNVNRGIAYHTFVVPNKKEFVVAGTVTIRNKSGVPKTMPFKKTIRVLPKED